MTRPAAGRRVAARAAAHVALGLVAGCAHGVDPPQARGPSFVFVSVDTLSARHMSLYGYERRTTPELDAWAREAVVFDRCTANAPWTTPSYMSQLTGLYPGAFRPLGVEPDDEGWPWPISPERSTLAEVLAAAGYRTAAFTDNPNIRPGLGFDQGFELYDTQAAAIPAEDPDGGIRNVAPRALAWLDRLGADEPFFLFVQVLDVHGPYLPDEPWRGGFAADGVGGGSYDAPVALQHGTIFGAIPRYIAAPVLAAGGDAAALPTASFVEAYDEEIRALDAELGAFLRGLEERGLVERTCVIVSADHGESMTEHASLFDHQLLYGADLHVPLLFRGRGVSAPRRVSERVQLVDLYPTVLELAGRPLPAMLHGRSLVPFLEGGTLAPAPTFAQGDLLEARAVVSGNWKLVEQRLSVRSCGIVGFLSHPRVRRWLAPYDPRFSKAVFGTAELPPATLDPSEMGALWGRAQAELLHPWLELYDLEQDPGELHDLAATEPDVVSRLSALLDERSREAMAARLPRAASAGAEPTAAEAAELEKLGY